MSKNDAALREAIKAKMAQIASQTFQGDKIQNIDIVGGEGLVRADFGIAPNLPRNSAIEVINDYRSALFARDIINDALIGKAWEMNVVTRPTFHIDEQHTTTISGVHFKSLEDIARVVDAVALDLSEEEKLHFQQKPSHSRINTETGRGRGA